MSNKLKKRPKKKRKHLSKHDLMLKAAGKSATATEDTKTVDDVTVEEMGKGTNHWPNQLLISVGQKLHMSRKVQPITDPKDIPEGSTYDDLVGITYGPLDCTCGKIRVTASPRRIGVTEVAQYASSSCKTCHGVGKWRITRTGPVGRDDVGQKILNDFVYERACPCAEKAYKASHHEMLIDSQYDEWIALEGLTIEEVGNEVVDDEVSVVQEPSDDQLQRGPGVSELPEADAEGPTT